MTYRKLVLSCVTVAAAALALAAQADDTVRCATGRLVHVGMVSAEVVARCGEPKSRAVEDVPVRARLQNGNLAQVGTTRIERWVYQRGQGQFPAQLRFEDDKLVRIDLIY